MPKFSKLSFERLETCHPDLIRLATTVVAHTDCTVVCGHRNKSDQTAALDSGASKTPWPKSKHNTFPSTAIDLAPYAGGVVWATGQCYYFAGIVMETARALGIAIRWGGDWDRNGDVRNQAFNDLVHFELVNP